MEGPEGGFLLAKLMQHVQEVTRRARQSVQATDDDGIALANPVQQSGQLAALRSSAADRLLKDAAAACGFELFKLGSKRLTVRAYASIAKVHRFAISHIRFTQTNVLIQLAQGGCAKLLIYTRHAGAAALMSRQSRLGFSGGVSL
jgi:hypothetical protein